LRGSAVLVVADRWNAFDHVAAWVGENVGWIGRVGEQRSGEDNRAGDLTGPGGVSAAPAEDHWRVFRRTGKETSEGQGDVVGRAIFEATGFHAADGFAGKFVWPRA
jgi:hypothetical protein